MRYAQESGRERDELRVQRPPQTGHPLWRTECVSRSLYSYVAHSAQSNGEATAVAATAAVEQDASRLRRWDYIAGAGARVSVPSACLSHCLEQRAREAGCMCPLCACAPGQEQGPPVSCVFLCVAVCLFRRPGIAPRAVCRIVSCMSTQACMRAGVHAWLVRRCSKDPAKSRRRARTGEGRSRQRTVSFLIKQRMAWLVERAGLHGLDWIGQTATGDSDRVHGLAQRTSTEGRAPRWGRKQQRG